MIPKTVICPRCGEKIEVGSYRKFVVCPVCQTRFPFEGFAYRVINWKSSMYDGVKRWTDCPNCRSRNMYLGTERKKWKCPDCGYAESRLKMYVNTLWFCDDCEAYLNAQKGFTPKTGRWTCTACGKENDVTDDNII